MDASAAHSDAELCKAFSMDLPMAPPPIRVTAAQFKEQGHGGPNHLPSTTSSSCWTPEMSQPLLECPPTPHSRGSSRGSFCSDNSTDLWISAVVPGHPVDSPLADSMHSTWKQPSCGRADSLSSPPSNWGTAKQEQPAAVAAYMKAPTAWDAADSGFETAPLESSSEAQQQAGVAAGPAVEPVQTPMQDLSTLLAGCPPSLHIAFSSTAAALAEQHQQQHHHLQQQLVLAQQGYTALEQPHLEQLLLQQQQGHRYNLVPIAALPMLLATAVPHWSGADVGYAALQIRCHLNVLCEFSLDTPKAPAALAQAKGSSSSSSPRSPSSWPQHQEVTGHAIQAAIPAQPCDLMYAELASTILAAAATEAAVGQQQLPAAVQGLLVDFTAELSSNAALLGKLHEVFGQEAAAAAAAQPVPSLQGLQKHSSAGAQGVVAMQTAAAAAAAEAQVPVVKAVKLLCKLLVGPTSLSDIRLLAWLTCLVRQQHLANQQLGLQAAARTALSPAAAAAAPGESASALISCAELLHVLSQLMEQLTGGHEDQPPPPPSYEASAFYPASDPSSPTGYSPHTWQFGHHSTTGDHSSSALPLQVGQQGWPGDDSQWELGRRRARQQYSSSSGSAVPSEGSTFSCPDSPSGWVPLQGSNAVNINGTSAAGAAAFGGSMSQNSSSLPTAAPVSEEVQQDLTAWWGVGDINAGRAAHRPISATSSFGADVWSIVAAAAAGDTSLIPQQAGLVPPQLQDLVSGQPTFGPPRVLRHQNTWPGRTGHSSRSRSGSDGGRSGSSDGGSGGSSASSKTSARSSSSHKSSRLSRMSLPGMAQGGTLSPSDIHMSAVSSSPVTMYHNAVWEESANSTCTGHATAAAATPAVLIPAVRPVRLHGSSRKSMQQLQQEQEQRQQKEERDLLLAQQHAWQAEMLLVHQPWEGAVSPIAACRNWGPFAAAESGHGQDRKPFGSFVVEGSGGGRSQVKEVQILRISSGSYRSYTAFEDEEEDVRERSGC